MFIYNMLAVFFEFIFRARYESALINDNCKLNKTEMHADQLKLFILRSPHSYV